MRLQKVPIALAPPVKNTIQRNLFAQMDFTVLSHRVDRNMFQ